MDKPLCLFFAAWMIILTCPQAAEVVRDGFDSSSLTGWKTKDGQWTIANGSLEGGVGFSALLREKETFQNGTIDTEVG